jgi:hypothetical protein
MGDAGDASEEKKRKATREREQAEVLGTLRYLSWPAAYIINETSN